jgi:DNA-binding transcriptional MerR regulator
MDISTGKEWTLKELAKETGVSERTIRFYISRKLVDQPLRAGRGAAYGEKHRDRVLAIRKLQAKGLMLAEIEHVLAAKGEPEARTSVSLLEGDDPTRGIGMLWFNRDGSVDENVAHAGSLESEARPAPAWPGPTPELPEPETWRSFVIAGDVVVMLRAGAAPWRSRRVTSALRRFAAEVGPSNLKEDQGE